MSWRLAYALEDYRNALNARFPNRNKASDGTIGDTEHAGQGQGSDHNPWIVRGGVGVVRAIDVTHDPANGVDCYHLSDRLFDMARAGDRRLRSNGYIIFDGWISNQDWSGWHEYDGSNPHSHHMHVSFSDDRFDDRGDWSAAFPPAPSAPRPPALPTIPTPEEIMQAIRSKIDPNVSMSAEDALAFIDYHTNKTFQLVNQLAADIPKQIEAAVAAALRTGPAS